MFASMKHALVQATRWHMHLTSTSHNNLGGNIAHHPFRLKDFQLFIGQKHYNSATAPNSVLTQADFVSILFTTQNNGVKGKLIEQRRSVYPQVCPVESMRRRAA